MDKIEFKNCELNIKKLDPTMDYLFTVEVGNMTTAQIRNCLEKLRDALSSEGIRGVYIPSINGVGKVSEEEIWSFLTKTYPNMNLDRIFGNKKNKED